MFPVKRTIVILAASLTASVVYCNTPALATEPSHAEHAGAVLPLATKPVDATLGALVGYGSNEFDHVKGAPNPYNVGFGFAAGLTFLDAAYVGVNFVYYVGQNGPSAINIDTGERGSFRMNSITATLDAGYRFRFARDITLRPYLGIGLLERMAAIPGASANTHNLYLAPSLALQVPLTGSSFVGADLRYGLAFSNTNTHSNVSGLATVGYHF